MAVKTNQTWTLYKRNDSQEKSKPEKVEEEVKSKEEEEESEEEESEEEASSEEEESETESEEESSDEDDDLTPVERARERIIKHKWQSRRIKHELSTKHMAVKRNQTWTLYKTNGNQDE